MASSAKKYFKILAKRLRNFAQEIGVTSNDKKDQVVIDETKGDLKVEVVLNGEKEPKIKIYQSKKDFS
ncbi:MAG: hypothetical protein MK212_16115 [Saprospiraceae bacterium]|nr:hypothetical protein [Saprospiraceae bacterium]